MSTFPRTTVGGLSLSRLLIGTNWFLGYSHCTAAKDSLIQQHTRNRTAIADILAVFLEAGVDSVMGLMSVQELHDGIKTAEDRTGKGVMRISTPGFPITADTPLIGLDHDAVARILDHEAAIGTHICMPHQSTTDALVDRCSHTIRRMDQLLAMIRERGMVPGLSTHMPEGIVYADESGLDVETYISIYNSMGFMMQIEVDWVADIIRRARQPVMTIKPMAAGQLRPFQALTFAWNSIRPQDMVTVGTFTPDEARECIELSMRILSNQAAPSTLQETRSKQAVKTRVSV
jgi:hypothetical protein